MKTIEDKFEEFVNSDYLKNDNYSFDKRCFEAGYELAKKEMEERLKEAEFVIKFYASESPQPGGCVDNDYTNIIRLVVPSNKPASKYLDKWGKE